MQVDLISNITEVIPLLREINFIFLTAFLIFSIGLILAFGKNIRIQHRFSVILILIGIYFFNIGLTYNLIPVTDLRDWFIYVGLLASLPITLGFSLSKSHHGMNIGHKCIGMRITIGIVLTLGFTGMIELLIFYFPGIAIQLNILYLIQLIAISIFSMYLFTSLIKEEDITFYSIGIGIALILFSIYTLIIFVTYFNVIGTSMSFFS